MMLTVIICTHNPRLDYLKSTLQGLEQQTLPQSEWDLLVIDNRSDEPIAARVDLAWHANTRVVVEDKLGLTAARIRGIQESKGTVLVFVDDDNVLASDYLERVVEISQDHPRLGAWGSGQITPQFEQQPANDLTPYIGMLALHTYEHDLWANLTTPNRSIPIGAGLCLRKEVAETYWKKFQVDSQRADLDRIGASLSSCGDTDLALCACDIGMGTGVFCSLQLQHLISKERVQPEYLLRLAQAFAYSGTILASFREKDPRARMPNARFFVGQWLFPLLRSFLFRGFPAKIAWAQAKGNYEALLKLRQQTEDHP